MRVTLKLATSLDGRIATRSGHSQWITGADARTEVHRLRSEHQTILTGVGTVLADDPQMTARISDGAVRQPVRLVMDTHLRTPVEAQILNTGTSEVWILTSAASPGERVRVLEAAGAKVIMLPLDQAGRVSALEVCSRLAKVGISTLMVEAGAGVATSFMRTELVDRIEWFRAPFLIGGDGMPVVSALGVDRLEQVQKFSCTNVRKVGSDIWETYERGVG